MVKGKSVRQKGKLKLSEYFKKLNIGDRVAVVTEKSTRISYPKVIQGRTGEIIGERGNFKLVKINDKDSVKTYIIHPIHLKRM